MLVGGDYLPTESGRRDESRCSGVPVSFQVVGQRHKKVLKKMGRRN